MTREADLERARAYLLGTAAEHESDALEEAYFESAGALDTVEAAEETLIEDYLSGALHSEDRTRFERHYLAAPQRRNRVEAIRKLMAHANRAGASVARRTPPLRVLAVAAALVIVAGASAAVWIAERGRGADVTGAAPTRMLPTTSAQSAPTKAPVTFAFSVSPAAVRGAEDTPALVVPPGTDVVNLQLEGEAAAPPVARGRVVIRTVDGTEFWQGAVAASMPPPVGVAAVASVPAARLRADDYTITLFERDAAGVETERSRYFLRVRER